MKRHGDTARMRNAARASRKCLLSGKQVHSSGKRANEEQQGSARHPAGLPVSALPLSFISAPPRYRGQEQAQSRRGIVFKHTKLFIVIIIITSTITIIFQSRCPVSLGDFHLAACQKDWSVLFLFFFFPPRHTWKLFLVVWVFCILRIIKGLSCKESGKGRALIIINSAKANNILG